MYGRDFKRLGPEGVRSEKIETPERLVEILKQEFGIELDAIGREKLAHVFAAMS
jgi:hypothetical protein